MKLPSVEEIDRQPLEALPGLVAELAALQTRAAMRLRMPGPQVEMNGDTLVAIDEAAARLGVTTGWLKKRPDLPFRVVLSEGTVRYSTVGIAAYVRARRGR